MSKKKPAPDERRNIHLRLDEEQCAAIDADLKKLPGIPVSRGAYAKHAVMSYAKLRQLEGLTRALAAKRDHAGCDIARNLLTSSGIS